MTSLMFVIPLQYSPLLNERTSFKNMDLKLLASAVEQIAAERGITLERVTEAVASALASAYKKEYMKKSEIVRAKFDSKTGEADFWQIKVVVDPKEVRIVEDESADADSVPSSSSEASAKRAKTSTVAKATADEEDQLLRYNPDRHIFLKEAKKIKSDTEVGDELVFPLKAREDFGRIAAQTAKQVILQNIREAERTSVMAEFAGKEGEVMSGVVQRIERNHVYIDLGRAMGVMFQNETIPGEHYRVGGRLRFYVLAVQEEERSKPGIVLSRAHPDFVKKLFEIEVPEIAEKVVEIKKITREPGSRTKIAVESHQEEIDPVGSVVGQRGARIMAVINELGNEKIDVIEWSDNIEKYLANSLSPAKVKLVEVKPRREALVLVEENQLSLAIGRGGQNVRLAAKLTGWKIDVRSQSRPEEVQEGGVAETAKAENDDGEKEVEKKDESKKKKGEVKKEKKGKKETVKKKAAVKKTKKKSKT